MMSVHFFTNLIKIDVDVDGNEMSPLIFNTHNIRETTGSFAHGPYYHLVRRYVFILLTKNADQDQNCSFDLISFQR